MYGGDESLAGINLVRWLLEKGSIVVLMMELVTKSARSFRIAGAAVSPVISGPCRVVGLFGRASSTFGRRRCYRYRRCRSCLGWLGGGSRWLRLTSDCCTPSEFSSHWGIHRASCCRRQLVERRHGEYGETCGRRAGPNKWYTSWVVIVLIKIEAVLRVAVAVVVVGLHALNGGSRRRCSRGACQDGERVEESFPS